jgi:predicted alpha/beta hydrolase family esterase
MEDQMTEILGFLRHTNPDVKKLALTAVFQHSMNEEVVEYIKNSEMMNAIKACLYDIVSLGSTVASSKAFHYDHR